MNYSGIQAIFHDYVAGILSKYLAYKELVLPVSIGWDGATASERKTRFTPPVDQDALIFAGGSDFSNAFATVKITDTASGYVWTLGENNQNAPVNSIFGVSTQVMPLLPLVCPFFLARQSKLQMEFVNSATSLTTNGVVTWRGIKLLS